MNKDHFVFFTVEIVTFGVDHFEKFLYFEEQRYFFTLNDFFFPKMIILTSNWGQKKPFCKSAKTL